MPFRRPHGNAEPESEAPEELNEQWEAPEKLKEQWINCLTDDQSRVLREPWVNELLAMAVRVSSKRDEAARKTASAHWLARGSAGVSAGVATLTGGALIGGIGKLNSTAATYFGIAIAGVGLLAAGIAAARPDQSYSEDLVRKALYEQLWWDMRSYGITVLPVADSNDFKNAMKIFAQRLTSIMSPAAPASK